MGDSDEREHVEEEDEDELMQISWLVEEACKNCIEIRHKNSVPSIFYAKSVGKDKSSIGTAFTTVSLYSEKSLPQRLFKSAAPFYFEVEVNSLPVFGTITVGFSCSNGDSSSSFEYPLISCGLSNRGEHFYKGKKISSYEIASASFDENDVVGIGWHPETGEVFFTIHGIPVETVQSSISVQPKISKLRPFISFDAVGTCVTTNFGSRPFCWSGNCLNSMAPIIQQTHEKQFIEEEKEENLRSSIAERHSKIDSIQSATEKPRIVLSRVRERMRETATEALHKEKGMLDEKSESQIGSSLGKQLLQTITSSVNQRILSMISPPLNIQPSSNSYNTECVETYLMHAKGIEFELKNIQKHLELFGEFIFDNDSGKEIAETVETVDLFITNFRQIQIRILNLLLVSSREELFYLIEVEDLFLNAVATVEGLQKKKSLETFFRIQQPFDVQKHDNDPNTHDECTIPEVIGLLLSKLLGVLTKSQNEDAKINSALVITYLLRDHTMISRAREWAHLKCCAGGSLKFLLYTFKSTSAARNIKLKYACAAAVAALTTCPWMKCAQASIFENDDVINGDPYTAVSDLVDISSSWSILIELLTPFETELLDVLNCLVYFASSSCECCVEESCIYAMREATLGIANLCLILSCRDYFSDLEEEPEFQLASWSEIISKSTARFLVSICIQGETRFGHDFHASTEAYHFALFAISLLAQYPAARLPLIDGKVQAPITRGLSSKDQQVVLYALATLVGLCSASEPFYLVRNTESNHALFRRQNRNDLYTMGYVSTQLIEAGTLNALLELTREYFHRTNERRIRYIIVAVFSFLLEQVHCRDAIFRSDGLNIFLKLCYSICMKKTRTNRSLRQSSCPSRFEDHEESSLAIRRNQSEALTPDQDKINKIGTVSLDKLDFATLKITWTQAAICMSRAIFWSLGGESKPTSRLHTSLQTKEIGSFAAEETFLHNHGARILIYLSKNKELQIQLNIARTIHLLSQHSDQTCEKVVRSGLVQIITEQMMPKKNGNPMQAEIRLVSCGILGNLANGSFVTRALVAKNGALAVVLAILSALYIDKSGPQGSEIEIAHQCVRVVAGLAELTPGNSYEEVISGDIPVWRPIAVQLLSRFGQTLDLLNGCLDSPANIVISEACRALAALARSTTTSWHKRKIVETSLRRFVELATRSDIHSSSLQKNAEDALIALGFTEGVNDVALCGGDMQSLYEWFCMDNCLEMQPLLHAVLLASSVALWRIPINKKVQDWLDAVINSSSVAHSLVMYQSSESVTQTPGEYTESQGTKSPEKYMKQLSFGGESLASVTRSLLRFGSLYELRRLVACRERGKSTNSDDEIYSRDDAFDYTLKDTSEEFELSSEEFLRALQEEYRKEPHRDVISFFTSILEVQRVIGEEQQTSAKDEVSPQKIRHACQINDRFSVQLRPGTKGAESILPKVVGSMLKSFFPSRLQRRHMILPYGNYHDLGLFNFIPRRPLAVVFPSRTYFSFRSFFGRAISRFLSKYGDDITERFNGSEGCAAWSLCFRDCEFSGDFHERLTEALHSLPGITSISFFNSKGRSIPVNSPTLHEFKNMSSDPTRSKKDTLDLGDEVWSQFCLVSLLKELPPSIEWCCFDNVLNRESVRLLASFLAERIPNIAGIALRNSKLTLEDLIPVIELLRIKRDETTTRRKSDESEPTYSSELLKQVAPRLSLRFVDLSGNQLGDIGCAKVIEAASYSATIEALDLSRNRVGEIASKTVGVLISTLAAPETCFVELHLAENGIGPSAGVALFQSLASENSRNSIVGSLNVLNLKGNKLEGVELEKRIASSLKSCSNLHELDVSENLFTSNFVASLASIITENSVLHFLGLGGISNMRVEDILMIEKVLFQNREDFYNRKTNQVTSRKAFIEENAIAKFTRNPSIDAGSVSSTNSIDDPPIDTERFYLNRPSLSVLFSIPLAAIENGHARPLKSLNYKQEQDHLWASFANAQKDIELRFSFATVENLRAEVNNSCQAIHYSGHGGPGALYFENGRGGIDYVSTGKLKSICSAGGKSGVKFVFISACHSEHAGKAFVEAGVPHVVCTMLEDRVLDRHAQKFSKIFYHSLANGFTVRKAFDIAQGTLDLSLVEPSKFLLLPEGGDHNVAIFPNVKPMMWPPLGSGGLVALHPSLWKYRSPFKSLIFIGRNVETYLTLNTVLSPSHIATVVGDEGVGKSELARAVASYVEERGLFRDGVLFVRMEGRVRSVSALVLTLLCSIKRDILKEASISATDIKTRYMGREGPGDEEMEDLVDSLIEILRFRRTLIVLDHCDALFEAPRASSEFDLFLGRLKDGATSVQFLLTSRKSIFAGRFPGFPVKTLELKPLHPRFAASLFLHLCPHSNGMADLHVPGMKMPVLGNGSYSDSPQHAAYDMLASLSEDNRIRRTGYMPKKLAALAYSISSSDYNRMIQESQNVVRSVNSVIQYSP